VGFFVDFSLFLRYTSSFTWKPHMKVHITDEFHTVWSFESNSTEDILKILEEWLKNLDETPIYDINIEIP